MFGGDDRGGSTGPGEREMGGREPEQYPHIEKRGEMYHCSMYGGKFDREAFRLAGECPVCKSVGEAQERRMGEGLFGGL
jgi:hypothetical protein